MSLQPWGSLLVSSKLRLLLQKRSWALQSAENQAGRRRQVPRMGTRSVSGAHLPQTCRWPSCWESTVEERRDSQNRAQLATGSTDIIQPAFPDGCAASTPMDSTNFASKLKK